MKDSQSCYGNKIEEDIYSETSSVMEVPKVLATLVSYTEEEVLQWINEYENEWAEDNQINSLAYAPKKRALTPYMLFTTSERKKLPNGCKSFKIWE